jgi:hypothetical protein
MLLCDAAFGSHDVESMASKEDMTWKNVVPKVGSRMTSKSFVFTLLLFFSSPSSFGRRIRDGWSGLTQRMWNRLALESRLLSLSLSWQVGVCVFICVPGGWAEPSHERALSSFLIVVRI